MGCTSPLGRGVGTPYQRPVVVGSKLPLQLCADVRLHIPMTHNDNTRYAHRTEADGSKTIVASTSQPRTDANASVYTIKSRSGSAMGASGEV